MRNYSKIALAVGAALGSGSALAVNPVWTQELVIAGSSALRDATANEMTILCAPNAVTTFVSAKGTGGSFDTPDFRAFQCTLGAAAGAGLTGTSVIVFYRSEGGSVFGVFGNPGLNGGVSLQINRLNPGPSGGAECQDNGGGGVILGISQTVANVEADNQATNAGSCVTKDTVDLGFSDVEPAAFVGENYGSEYTFIPFKPPTVTQLNSLDKGRMIGQVWTAIMSNAGGATSLFASANQFSTHGLTSQELASIFTGKVTDWGNVPSAQALGAAAGNSPITLCRREPGSGTQTVAATHFLLRNCGSTNAGLAFDTPGSGSGNNVVEGFATSDVLTCVQTGNNAIGIVTAQTAAKITGAATQILVDGQGATAANGNNVSTASAQGQYNWYSEAYFVKNDVSMPAGSFQLALANKLIADLQNSHNTPAQASVPNLIGIPGVATGVNAPFSPVTPFKAGQQIPIAIGTTGGSTCQVPTDVL